jgi:carbonic anhydrase
MEMHCVHINVKYGMNLEEATKHPDGITVLASFFALGQSNEMLHPIWTHLAPIQGAGTTNRPNITLDLAKLFSPSLPVSYLYYQGSLTTPPCSEHVQWIIDPTIQFLSMAQLNLLRQTRSELNRPIVNNTRPLQARNNRNVYLSFDPQDID